MGEAAIKLSVKKEDGKLMPRGRAGTKNFMDVPMELRLKDFESESGEFFISILPPEIARCFKQAIMETGIESEDALKYLEYALSMEENGKPISPIAQWVHDNPYNPRVFKYLYGEAEPLSPMDKGYTLTTGSQAICLRLKSLIKRLPNIIRDECQRFEMKSDEKYVIYNIGASFGLDTIYMMAENLDLRGFVKIVNIDPDEASLVYGRNLAEKLGVVECFQFVPKKIEEVKDLDKAHMLLFIGMFCPVPTKKCVLTLNFIKKFIHEKGIVIFSTVQEKMLLGGPILDFIMWSYGWRMYFKTDKEPARIVAFAGLTHEKDMDWEDEFGYNRMTVARNVKHSVFKKVGDVARLVRILMM